MVITFNRPALGIASLVVERKITQAKKGRGMRRRKRSELLFHKGGLIPVKSARFRPQGAKVEGAARPNFLPAFTTFLKN